ncbi:Methenyltetrahydrofolate cyclohydrolase [Candidatus Filomicrobium marinum]|uniref:Methenyltetrahydrofolate cyclohydrolase n=1 Tax=Candidatus Filomicrobium marinum TaxID=1608628 RepID=A0A0D6JAN3_9HYPH|nr:MULTISPECIES: cyclodeaminase/cyclohydrolase family protein [Filomicrobium]MCV0371058.1 cyclodeaminase/cyclohydrolase family protein [Filomicrobium sp.]CFX03338.1 Methenyltetrahydrofolate cyclohydrolase [Candidatus Filomicrobium marinum]CPR15826.1 Methenyltetrahydrofolate cyclohydrolase [Candidatus Filomicrobium marinum]
MLTTMSLEEFGAVLASDAPAPGGGSVAALSGAVGAGLIAMVCRLSIGKKGCEAFTEELTKTVPKADALAAGLLRRVDLDTEAFNSVMAAFKLPKQTDEEKAKRTAAIQDGYKEAVQSPIAIASECVAVLELSRNLLGKSNPNALSDLGVASQQAYAGLEGAIMNVKINLPSIKDENFKSEISTELVQLLKQGREAKEQVYQFVSDNL